MAIGWLKVIQSVPWSDVISNAPKVADGAKGLWDRMSKKVAADTEASDDVAPTQTAPTHTLEQLQSELAALRSSHLQLETQMLGATELINSLAQQNQDLVQRVDRLQSQMRWLRGVCALGVLALCVVALKWVYPSLLGF
jgi:septal ring factor EnvC (AmiA/AmiB activator)